METNNWFKEIDRRDNKQDVAKQLEEYKRKLFDHYRKNPEQRRKPEDQNQELYKFVCDWQ